MVTLTGTFTRLDGDPATGTVKITPSRSPIMDSAGRVVISGPQVFPLDKDGKLNVTIPASDDPDIGPPITYTVAVELAHASWKISKVWIPHGSATVDLSEIGDYQPTPGVATRVVTIPADGEDGHVLVWDGAGFSWGRVLGPDDLDRFDAQVAAVEHAAQRAEAALAAQPVDAGELIASRLAFRQGDITVGIASDSTSNDPTDWVRLWEAHLAERYPHLRIENNQWNSANGAYGPTTVVQEGEGEPAFSGEVLHDTFTRTTGIENADSGGPWTAPDSANIVLDGTTIHTTGGAILTKNTGGKDIASTTVIDINTSTTVAQNLRLYHGDATHGSYLQLSVMPSGNLWAYVSRASGDDREYTRVNLTSEFGLTPGATLTDPVEVTIKGQIQNHAVAITHGDQEWTYAWRVPESDYSAMDPVFQYYPTSATPGLRVSEITLNIADRPATYQTLRVWSGTMSGGTLQYQIDNWDAMFGDEVTTPGTEETTETRTLTDSFARTGTLAGSTTDTGQTWAGSTAWTSDGTKAQPTSDGSVTLPLTDATRVTANLEAITTPPPNPQTLRLGLHTIGDGTHGIMLSLAMDTTGLLEATAYVRTPTGGYRPFPALGSVGLTPGQAVPQSLTVGLTLDGLTVTATAGTKTGSWEITTAEAAELGANIELLAVTPDLAGRVAVLDIEADYVHTTPATDPVYGDPLDVMIIGHGHNYGQRRGPEFITILEGFLGHMRDRRPSTLPLLSSQNPQFPPTANPGPHADRQLALRRYARENGYRYAPVFEHFAAQPDSGRSWVNADGVHPTGPATPTPTPGTGMSEWGKVLAETVTD